MAKSPTYLIEGERYSMDDIQARLTHEPPLSRTAIRKRLDCYEPTWAKLEAPRTPREVVLRRGRNVVNQTYKEIFPCW
jgi:hypothetical protein